MKKDKSAQFKSSIVSSLLLLNYIPIFFKTKYSSTCCRQFLCISIRYEIGELYILR